MAGRLSFSIAINFLTENFKKGTNSVKAGFRAMQMQVLTFAAALGAGGLGLSNFISRMIDTARETNRVTTALKNVSGSLMQFADNQRFLLDISNKYGIEINSLTGSFSKFTASATNAGVSIANQKKIFESVSRATTAFGLSADETNGVMLALSQMMGKGKISSEELRKQMGEKLPVAMAAMAKATGTSMAGLEKLLKQGKLMSADVLPKFADALNEMIPDVDTDNLESSINRLKNSFSDFVSGMDVQSKYKSLIDWLTEQVKSAANNIRNIVASLIAILSGVLLGRFFKWIVVELAKAQRQAMLAAARAARAAGQAFDEAAWKAQSGAATMRTAFTRAATAIRAAFMSMLPTAIFTVITSIISKMVLARKEAERIRNLYEDYQRGLSGSVNTVEVARLEKLKKLADDTTGLNEKHKIWSQIGTLMGEVQKKNESDLDYQGRINKKFEERIALLKSAAEIDYLYRQKLETEDKIRSLQSTLLKQTASTVSDIGGKKDPWSGPLGIKTLWNILNPFSGLKTVSDETNSELTGLNRILSDVNKRLEGAETSAANLLESQTPTGDEAKKKKTPLEKAEEKYAESLLAYNNQLKSSVISQEEYNKAIDDLSRNTIKEIGSILGESAKENETFVKAMSGISAPLSEFEKVQKDYNEELTKLGNQKKNGAITEKEYQEELKTLSEKTAKAAGAIDGIGTEGQAFVAELISTRQNMKDALRKPIELKERDTTFDYKKTETERLSEELKIYEKYRDELKDAVDDGAQYLQEELDKVMSKTKTLGEALKIAEVREDIKNLSKELNEGIYDGIKDIASSSDRVVGAFSNLREVMSDVDASGWERIMAIWNAMTNTIDAFLSVIKMIETLTEVTNKLKSAKESEIALDTIATQQKITNATTAATADAAIATGEIATRKAVATSAQIEMAAKTTAAYAGIPFIGQGLAAAQIAAMEAMILAASIPKFARGGIVPGTSTSGDNVLARVNSGEMILNQSQQSNLFRMLNSGGNLSSNNTGNNEVKFRISGTDLVGVINNWTNRKSKIR